MRIEREHNFLNSSTFFSKETFYSYHNPVRSLYKETPIVSANLTLINDFGREQLDELLKTEKKSIRFIESSKFSSIKELAIVSKTFNKNFPNLLQGNGIILTRIQVDKHYRNKGIGTRLINDILTTYKIEGYDWIFLNPLPLNSENLSEDEYTETIERLIFFYTDSLGFEFFDHKDFLSDVLSEFNNDNDVDFFLHTYPGFCFKRL